MNKHTKLPWRVEKTSWTTGSWKQLRPKDGLITSLTGSQELTVEEDEDCAGHRPIVAMLFGYDDQEAETHEKMLLQAINSYHAMKDSLEGLLRYWDKHSYTTIQLEKIEDHIQKMRKALTLANGKEQES